MQLVSLLSPQNLLYILFILACAVYWLFTFTTFYHLVRFGIGTQPKRFAMVFLIGAGILFSLSLSALLAVDGIGLKEKLTQYTQNTLKINQ